MPAGFIYVLINPAMPGLAKVGKTTRNPSDRVSELSSATGVPSPFILAYQQPVTECDSAEVWVHRELERSGYRTSNNREFFNAPLHEIVQIVSKTAGLILPIKQMAEANESNENNTQTLDQLSNELYQEAIEYAVGTNSKLKNETKALALFEQAAKLGNSLACSSAAFYYMHAVGTSENLEAALTYYSKAVHLGSWWNEYNIAAIFLKAGQNSAAEEHWELYFRQSFEYIKVGKVSRELVSVIGGGVLRYCFDVIVDKKLPHFIHNKILSCLAGPLALDIEDGYVAASNNPSKGFAEYQKSRLDQVIKFIDDNWVPEAYESIKNTTSSYINEITLNYLEMRDKRDKERDRKIIEQEYEREKITAARREAANQERLKRLELVENRKTAYSEHGYQYILNENGQELPFSNSKHPDFFKAMQDIPFLRIMKNLTFT